MLFDQQIQGVSPQLGHHAGRMPQPHRPLAAGQQPLEDVVHRQVARAQASTFSPRRMARRISSTTAVVLPVPGGP